MTTGSHPPRADADEPVSGGTLTVGQGGVISAVDPAVAALLATTPEALVGRHARTLVHTDDLPTTAAIGEQVMLTPAATCRLRLRLLRADHTTVMCACTFRSNDSTARVGIGTITIAPSALTVSSEDGGTYRRDDPTVPAVANPLAPFTDHARLGVILSDHDGVQFVSPALAFLLGWEREELTRRLGELIHPEDQAASVAFIREVNNGDHQAASTRVRVARGDGSWARMHLTTVDLTDDPDFAVFVTVVTPADDHHELSRPARRFDQFRDTMEFATEPVVILGTRATIQYATPLTAKLLGRGPSDLFASSFLDHVDPDDRAVVAGWFSGEGDPSAVRARLRRPDGTSSWVEIHPLLTDDAGHSTSRVFTLHPIDEQVRAEQELTQRELYFAALLRNAPGCVVVIDDGRITYASTSTERTLGLRRDLVVGLDLWHYAHPDDLPAFLAARDRVLSSKGAAQAQGRLRVGDGSWRWFEATLQSQEEAIDGIVVNLVDRTEAVQADLALKESERLFKSLVEHSFEITAILDDDLVISWVSPSVTEVAGWKPEDLIGTHALDLVHPDDVDAALRNMEAALAHVTPRPFTLLRIRENRDEWRWAVASLTDRRDDPSIRGVVINLRDATDQVASQKALESSENRYRTLIQNSTDVVQIMSASAQVTWVSPSIEHVLGYKPEEILDEPTGALAGLAGRESLVQAFLTVLAKPGSTARCVSRAQHADGSWRWIDVALVNQLHLPDIHGVVATYRDITERLEADQARIASEERFRSLAESSPLGIFQLDLDHRCDYVNDRWCEITGLSPGQSLGDGWWKPLERGNGGVGDPAEFVARYTDERPEVALIRPDGSERWCSLHFAPLTDDRGNRTGSVGTIDDITRAVESRDEARRLSTILQATTDLVLLFVPDGHLVYMNAAAYAFFDLDRHIPIAGTPVGEVLPAENIELWYSEILPMLARRVPWQGETTLRNQSGDVIPISAVVIAHTGTDGEIEVVSITARDISDRKAMEARLQHQATHDPLTGLPNRTLLMDRLEMAMARRERGSGILAVLFLDLDHFKVVNDSLGHGTGDELLVILGLRLLDQVRPGDTVARFGGDEFVIVCEDLDDTSEAEQIAERVARAMAEPAWIGESEVVVTSSVGIAIVDRLHQDPEQVLRDADAAMYQAKARGRARYELFDRRYRTRALDRLEVENALRRALARDELRVHYQPVFDLGTQSIVGVEALLRWQHPERKLLLPSEFLGIAEESGLILPIGQWVLRTACTHAQELQTVTPDTAPLDFAVNLSARQLSDPQLVEHITEILEETGMDPTNLTLEITESILMDDVVHSHAMLARLSDLGIRLAIDDFGTGYSSFVYLQKFPVDVLKVDRSFVSGLGTEVGDAAITQAIISLGHTLGLEVIAEGVENPRQMEMLQAMGCDRAQGFLLSRPLSSQDLTTILTGAPTDV